MVTMLLMLMMVMKTTTTMKTATTTMMVMSFYHLQCKGSESELRNSGHLSRAPQRS